MANFLPRPESNSDRIAKGLFSAASEGIPAIAERLEAQRKEKDQAKEAKTFFEDLAKDHPNNATYRDMAKLWGSSLPIEQKKTIAESLFARDPYKAERLKLDQQLGSIKSRIKMVQESLKTYLKPGEKETLKQELKQLQDLYTDMAGLSDLGQDFEEEIEKPEKTSKPRFDVKNPEHKAKSDQLFKKHKDKEKVREALRKEFEI